MHFLNNQNLHELHILVFLQIKKFKEALEKHGREQCSIGKTKGLEEKELIVMAANKDLSFDYKPKSNGNNQEQKEKHIVLPISTTSKEKEVEQPLLVSPAGIV